MRRGALLLVSVVASVVASFGVAHAATLQPIGTYSNPVFVTSEPDPDRLLVVEQGGTIKLTEDGSTSLFLNISDRITPGGEQGLLSMALSPDYETSGRFFVFYVGDPPDGDFLQIDEYTADATPPVDPATRRPVLTIPHPTAGNHNAGQLQFGPNDHLYISTGDGGNTPLLAQDTSVLLGKILRIDPDQSGSDPYTVPADNPFVGVAGADEIWSYGLRNPFRFSFDRATGAIAIGDVGGATAEEVDYEPQPNAGRGDNYGWPCREGFSAGPSSCSGTFTNPIHDYSHSNGNCSITGGYVARDSSLGDLEGRYLYADFCAGQIRSLVPGPTASCDRSEGISLPSPSSFGEDSSGRIYVASLSGTVHRLTGDTQIDCPPPPDPPPSGTSPAASQPTPDEPTPLADDRPPPAEPTLRLGARARQTVDGDRRLVCVVRSDQPTEAVARLALLAGGDALLRLGEKRLELDQGRDHRIGWKLSLAELRSLRRPLRDGRLEARFRAHPVDASGERGPRAEAISIVRK